MKLKPGKNSKAGWKSIEPTYKDACFNALYYKIFLRVKICSCLNLFSTMVMNAIHRPDTIPIAPFVFLVDLQSLALTSISFNDLTFLHKHLLSFCYHSFRAAAHNVPTRAHANHDEKQFFPTHSLEFKLLGQRQKYSP